MATPIYDRIRKSNKKNKTMAYFADGQPKIWKKGDKPIVETNIAGAPAPGIGPIKFTAVTGKPSAVYADNTIPDIVEATEEVVDDTKPDLGECVDGKNTVTGQDCKTPEELLEESQSKAEARKAKRVKNGGPGTGVGNFLRGLFGGGGKSTVAKLKEDPSGATIVEDQGTPIFDHEPGKPGPHAVGDARLAALQNAGEQGLGEGELITIGGDVYDSTFTGEGKGTEGKPAIEGNTGSPEFQAAFKKCLDDPNCKEFDFNGKPYKAELSKDPNFGKDIPAVPGTPGTPESHTLKKKTITETDPGSDAERQYNMGWADTVMQNWAEGAQRRGDTRAEDRNMDQIWKNMTKNERDQLKDVMKDMKDDGNAPRGQKNKRLAGIQEMLKRANDPKYAKDTSYDNYREGGKYFQNWGSTASGSHMQHFDQDRDDVQWKKDSANRNFQGAAIDDYVKTKKEVEASSNERDMKASDLDEDAGVKQYGSKEEWLEAKRLEAAGGKGADEEVVDTNVDNNPFADMNIKDFAKNLKTRTLSEFMEENPIGVKADIANKDASDKSVDSDLLETDPKNTTNVVTTKNVRGQATEDMSEDQKNTLNDLGVGVEDLKQREDIPTVEDEIIQEDELKLNYKPPTKFKMKRKPFIGRPGY